MSAAREKPEPSRKANPPGLTAILMANAAIGLGLAVGDLMQPSRLLAVAF